MVVVGMNDQCIPYLVPRNFNTLQPLLKHVVSQWSFDSQGFVFVFSEDLVVRLQSEPLGKNTKNKVRWDTEIWGRQWKQMSCSDLLVKEIFVHNSWNVEQGISHPKECVFTVWRQKHIVLCRLPLTSSAPTEDTNSLLWYGKSSVSDLLNSITETLMRDEPVFQTALLPDLLSMPNMCATHEKIKPQKHAQLQAYELITD